MLNIFHPATTIVVKYKAKLTITYVRRILFGKRQESYSFLLPTIYAIPAEESNKSKTPIKMSDIFNNAGILPAKVFAGLNGKIIDTTIANPAINNAVVLKTLSIKE